MPRGDRSSSSGVFLVFVRIAVVRVFARLSAEGRCVAFQNWSVVHGEGSQLHLQLPQKRRLLSLEM